MKGFSSFRAKLILTIFPVVAGVATGTLLLTEWRFTATYQQLFEEQFENQIAVVTQVRNRRFDALSTVLEGIAQNPTTLAAMRRGDFQQAGGTLKPALETLAHERLQFELSLFGRSVAGQGPGSQTRPGGGPGPGPARPGEKRGEDPERDRDKSRDDKGRPAKDLPRPPAQAGQNAPFIGLVDAKGNFLLNPRNRSTNPLAGVPGEPENETPTISRRSTKLQWLSGRKFEESLKQQEVGYLIVEAGERRGEQVREVFVTPLIDPADNKFLGAIVLGLPLPVTTDRILYETSKRTENGEIVGGVYLEGKLVSTTVPEDQRELVGRAVAQSIAQSSRETRELILPIGGVRHRVIYHSLNPDSPFPQAVQVNLYSLAALDREIAEMRRSTIGLGAVALLTAFVLVMFISRGLSGPVSTLVTAAQEIERGNYEVRVPLRRDEVGRLAKAFNEMAAGLALQEKYRSVLNAVADRTVAERLLENREALGGELRDVTMLFCDIRGFTALTEKMPPAEVIELLNEHMTALTQVAYEHGGIVDKFVGDLIMVLFGAPVSTGRDAQRAVECAQAMMRKRREMNATSRHPLEIGIGLATGSVVAGCMGSDQRLSYTVLGNRVNLASRLCGIAQPGEIIVDAETSAALPPGIPCTPLPPMQLKGFSTPVQLCRVESGG